MSLAYAILLISVVVLSAVTTAFVHRYAVNHVLMDVPNERSSHVVPTPRGGGVGIVVAAIAAFVWMLLVEKADQRLLWALLITGGAVAVIGFIDDHCQLAAKWRLIVHVSAAIWAVVILNGMPSIVFFDRDVHLGWLGGVVAVLYVVWLLNLYNFMDGIDGIASIEALCVCIGATIVHSLGGYRGITAEVLLLAASVAGFLFWNFPKAKIFMGDAGSGFLGVSFGVLTLGAGLESRRLLWSWVILLGVFIVDATFTLLRRLFRGCKVYQAHRSHAYQHAARSLGKHVPVTLAVAGIDILWLMPLAVCVGLSILDGVVGVLIAYTPLVLLAIRLKAGDAEESPKDGMVGGCGTTT